MYILIPFFGIDLLKKSIGFVFKKREKLKKQLAIEGRKEAKSEYDDLLAQTLHQEDGIKFLTYP